MPSRMKMTEHASRYGTSLPLLISFCAEALLRSNLVALVASMGTVFAHHHNSIGDNGMGSGVPFGILWPDIVGGTRCKL